MTTVHCAEHEAREKPDALLAAVKVYAHILSVHSKSKCLYETGLMHSSGIVSQSMTAAVSKIHCNLDIGS